MFESTQHTNNYHITFLRHGESVGNEGGIYQGQSDFPLNQTGIAQAEALAQYWVAEGKRFDRIITSPLSRARQTAEIIARELMVPLEEDPAWMERNNGKLAGLRLEEAAQRSPRPAFIHPYMPIGETGESQWELYVRGAQAVLNLIKRPTGRYLIVAHGGILNMVMYAILGIPPQANFHGPRFRFRNTAFASLTYNPSNHIWYLEGINDQSHWKSNRGNQSNE